MAFKKVFIIGVALLASYASGAASLKESFRSPPREAKPQTWWHWFGGHVTKEGITKDLEAMSRVGIGGVQNFHVNLDTPQGKISYDSPEWHKLIEHAISEAARLNIEYGFHICAGWAGTGGTWITPEYAMKQVVWSEQNVSVGAAGGMDNIALDNPLKIKDFYRDIAVLAYPTPKYEEENKTSWLIDNWQQKSFKYPHAKLSITTSALFRDERQVPSNAMIPMKVILDVTPYVKSGKLNVPPSVLSRYPHWTVMRFGYTATNAINMPAAGDGSGMECDKLSTKALDIHWDHLMARIKKDAAQNTAIFTTVLVDSFEQNYQNWTEGFESEFNIRRNYPITNWLVALTGRVINSVDQTERFLWDFRKTIAELYNQNYFEHAAKRAHEDHLKLAVEPYGMGNFDELGAALIADIPMGEFWANSYDERTPRMASSAGHIMGRKYIGAEAFTAHGLDVWTTNPYSMKGRGDYFFAKGINRLTYHTYVHQPWADSIKPGMNMGRFGFNFNRNNTWFEQSSPYLTYVARAQSLLQNGQAVKDILYVYGENVPNENQSDHVISPQSPAGYDFDKVGYQVLKLAKVRKDKITFPSGMCYRLLVLTEAQRTTPSLLKEIERLVAEGATILAERPVTAPGLEDYPHSDDAICRYVETLWESGRVKPHAALGKILTTLDLKPDFEAKPGEGIEFIHRSDDEADWYFVANIKNFQKVLNCTFRVKGKIPELWDPESGLIEPAQVWEQNADGRTSVELRLKPSQSIFVVFGKNGTPTRQTIVKSEFKPANVGERLLISAIYGAPSDPSKQVNVTQQIQKYIDQSQQLVDISNSLSGGKDPAKGEVKVLRIEGMIGGRKTLLEAKEGQQFDLSVVFKNIEIPPVRYLANSKIGLYEPGIFKAVRSDGTIVERRSSGVKSTVVSNPWEVHFGEYGPEKPVTFNKLTPWNINSDKAIRYFSGTAEYRSTFMYKKSVDSQGTVLDLGHVANIAELTLNGRNLGILWKPPFVVDAQDALVDGMNTIIIRVTNLAVNRIIGDEQYPETQTVRLQNTEPFKIAGSLQEIPDWVDAGQKNPDPGRELFFTFKYFDKNSPLMESGLLGEVRIVEPDIISID